ncbi:MAG: hypothetical protein DCC71_01685 [Proteobacteria bacterium]|nr:MAG: hypothetical protein DCC71_01685 [Pseudomonadota bacterium]
MRTIQRSHGVALAAAAVLGLAAASAGADIFAATCVAGSGGNPDIAILNASLGTRVALPAVVNSADTELDPSISRDGRRLSFRRTSSTGVHRHLVVQLDTGASADLFTGLEISQTPVFGSTITPNGAYVFTGRRFSPVFGLSYPRVFLTELFRFPSGPLSRSTLTATRFNFRNAGNVNDVAVSAGPLYVMEVSGLLGSLVLNRISGSGGGSGGSFTVGGSNNLSSFPLRSTSFDYSQPALADEPDLVYFKQRRVVNNVFQDGDIAFRPATLEGFPGTPTRVLGGVSTSAEESQPALTADGRYLAFVRGGTGGANDRLFVWDPLTQTMLNPNGVDLGLQDTSSRCGSLSLYTRSILASGTISRVGDVNATLLQASSIGIFVQRIVGETKVLGRKTYELETVGRVPLGSYGEGNVFTHWDFAVNGEPLPPGRYLVTLRAVEGDVVRELGEPRVLRIQDRSKHEQRPVSFSRSGGR